ncbi:MAG: molybdopterin molybdotransferase MoeA [SAR202 cluster bacterium]|nr:molybdopterin molybdotransferase MoeA [SAR202 cluster bacterium]
MLSVEEALERILGFFGVLEPEQQPILDSVDQVLAEDIVGRFDIPPLDNSSMDGYAVQAADVKSASATTPVVLRVIGTVAAGQMPSTPVVAGAAVRIMTGAPVPQGADAVVPFEETDEAERKLHGGPPDSIGVKFAALAGANVRKAGRDVTRGQLVLAKGAVVRAAEVGVLASLGYTSVSVIRRPSVAILATGDELQEPDEAPLPGRIYNVNSYSVGAAVKQAGGIPKLLGTARDNLDSLNAKIWEGLGSDILITSAGVSKGDYDIVKDVLAQHGRMEFWSVRMRPAKPLAFGVLKGPGGRTVPLLGLPGNPVSSMVAFEQFGRPAIHKMMGRTTTRRPTVQAVLDGPIYNGDGRRVYARAVITKRDGVYYARPTGDQSSNLLTSMAKANGLAICPSDVPMKAAGETVTVQMIDWPETVF